MRWRAVVAMAAVAAAVGPLTGCAPQVEMPAGPTRAEVQLIEQQAAAFWWHSMFPNEDPPVVRRVQYVSPDEQQVAVQQCINEAVMANPGASQQRAQWVCNQRFPVDLLSAPLRGAVLGRAQLEYLYAYFTERAIPCLRLAGYRVTDVQDRDTFMSASNGFPSWNPYFTMAAAPHVSLTRAQAVERCPPPPFAADMLLPDGPSS